MIYGDIVYLVMSALLMGSLFLIAFFENEKKLKRHIAAQDKRMLYFAPIVFLTLILLGAFLLRHSFLKGLENISTCSAPKCYTSHYWSLAILSGAMTLFFSFFLWRFIKYRK